jgi:hypothetical protein
MHKTNFLEYIVIFIIISLLSFPKEVFLDAVGFRIEDFTGLFGIFYLFYYFYKNKSIILPRSFLYVFLYYSYILCCTIVNDIVNQENFFSLLIFAKELTYLALFLLVLQLNKYQAVRISKIALLFLLPNVIYGIYQIVFQDPKGTYGIAPFGHTNSPASAGLIFYSGLLLSSYIFFECKEKIYKYVPFIFFLLTFMAGSKLAILGATIFYFLLLYSYGLHTNLMEFIVESKYFFLLFFLILIIIYIFFDSNNWHSLARYTGFLKPLEIIAERGIWWKFEWVSSLTKLVFGNGLSIGHYPSGKFNSGMALDNLYLYLIVTGGIIGSTLFLLMHFKLFADSQHHRKFYVAMLGSYIAMALGGEIFQLSTSGLLFWFFIAIINIEPSIKIF